MRGQKRDVLIRDGYGAHPSFDRKRRAIERGTTSRAGELLEERSRATRIRLKLERERLAVAKLQDGGSRGCLHGRGRGLDGPFGPGRQSQRACSRRDDGTTDELAAIEVGSGLGLDCDRVILVCPFDHVLVASVHVTPCRLNVNGIVHRWG